VLRCLRRKRPGETSIKSRDFIKWLRPKPPGGAHPSAEESYNRIAGQGLERLAALSDGVFAFAMTLLVLDIQVPALGSVHTEGDLCHALVALLPRFVMYAMSFLTLGIFWVGQQTQLNQLERVNRDLAWLHIWYLAAVALMPFSTRLLAEFIEYRTALLVYWCNILALGTILFSTWRYARCAHLIRPATAAHIVAVIDRRIVSAQCLYAFGAALCVINTYCSIVFIFLVQLNYALAPRFRRGARG
jgi:uncharacterized membrane protein